MKSVVIRMNNMADITTLVNRAGEVDGDVTLRRGIYVSDAKSMFGVFAIDLSEGATIEYPEDATAFDTYIKNFEA